MYPEELVAPMRGELSSTGFTELKTESEVVEVMDNQKGTALVVINSVCGCAAGAARPAAIYAFQNAEKKPTSAFTVFAGVDKEATNKMREYTLPYPPSSPCIALFKDGELVHFIERHHIEGRPGEMIAQNLMQAFDEHC